jgi:hypothetical protein
VITLKFLGTWLKVAGFTALALLAEWIFIHGVWWFVLVAGVTLLIFAGLTVALWREWRAGRAYTYQLVRHLRD